MYLVFDIGGTKTRMASSFDGISFQNIETVPTPQEFEKALDIIQKFIWKADSTHPENLFCYGLPGVLDKEQKTLVSAPHLPLWVDQPIVDGLKKVSTGEIFVANDASIAGLGEAVRGLGKNYGIVAYITIGTGIGGVRIVNKTIDKTAYGFEPGHQIIDMDGSLLGRVCDWEKMAGGDGIKINYSQSAEEISDETIWRKVESYIAYGLINVTVFWSPDIILLGGSVSLNENLKIENIAELMKKNLSIFPKIPEIEKSTLKDDAPLVGGVEFIKLKQSH